MNHNKTRPNEKWWKNIKASEWENEVNRRKKEGDRDYILMEKYILNYFSKFNNVKILDYGCGFGRNSINLIQNTSNEIFGVDLNKSMIEIVSKKIKDKNYSKNHFKVLTTDKKIPFPDDYFDYSFTNEVLIHIHPDDLEDTLKEIFRVTKNKVLLLENILVSETVQSNLAHDGCWLHNLSKVITNNFKYSTKIIYGYMDKQYIYEINIKENKQEITLYHKTKKIKNIETIGNQNLIKNLIVENKNLIAAYINKNSTIDENLKKYNEISSELIKLNDIVKNEKIKSNDFETKYKESNCELVKIHSSKLWKIYLLYRKIYNLTRTYKIIHLSKKNKYDTTNYYRLIKGNNIYNKKVLGICHEDWYGVKSATINQCSKVLLIKGISSYTHAKIIYEKIIKGKYKKICINGLPDNIEYLVDYIGNTDTSIKIFLVWHGSFTQQSENQDHIFRFNKLNPYFNKIYKFGFVKKDSEKIFSLMGLRSQYVPNLVSINQINKIQINNQNSSVVSKDVHISIPSLFYWHKNNVNQIIAATLIKNSKVSVLNFPSFDYLKNIFKNKITIHGYLNKIDFYKLLFESDIISYVSLTECYPMVFLESLALSKPCLIGKTSSFILDNNVYLKNKLVVENPEDIFEIKQKIIDVLKNYNKIVSEIKKFFPELIKENTKAIDLFFNE